MRQSEHASSKILDAHGPYLSDADEAEIVRRLATSDDVADLALRTCMCGRRLEGFDDYFEHLRGVLEASPSPSTGMRDSPTMTTPRDPETDVVLGDEVLWVRRTTGSAIVAVRVPSQLLTKIASYGVQHGLTLSDVLRTGAEYLIGGSSQGEPPTPGLGSGVESPT